MPLELKKSKWIIFIADIPYKRMYCLNPTSLEISDEINQMEIEITNIFKGFILVSDLTYEQGCCKDRLITCKSDDTGPLVCVYINSIVLNQNMLNIKTGNIVQLTKNLIQKEKKKCNVDKVKTATMSYSDRVNLSKIIQERVSSMDCDAYEIAVTKHIHDLILSGFQKVVSHDKLSLHKAVNPANDVKLINNSILNLRKSLN